jgi:hypothetical protein
MAKKRKRISPTHSVKAATILQTTESDIRAGWRAIRAWEHRFRHSIWNMSPLDPKNMIFLANQEQIQMYEWGEQQIDPDETASEYAVDEKIAFMKAYLSVVAIDSHNFESDVRAILKLQSHVKAPRALGFWFWQQDIPEFDGGWGVSPFFQGGSISIFCEDAKQIDFADISTIMPYDNIMVRHPVASWSPSAAQKIVNHIKSDLAHDGIETDLDFSRARASDNLLSISVLSPDYGKQFNASRLRALRAADIYREIVGEPRPSKSLPGQWI